MCEGVWEHANDTDTLTFNLSLAAELAFWERLNRFSPFSCATLTCVFNCCLRVSARFLPCSLTCWTALSMSILWTVVIFLILLSFYLRAAFISSCNEVIWSVWPFLRSLPFSFSLISVVDNLVDLPLSLEASFDDAISLVESFLLSLVTSCLLTLASSCWFF